MLADNVSLGVKIGTKLRNGNALLVSTKRKRLKRITERGEGKKGGSKRCLMDWQELEAGKTTVRDLCGILVFDGSLCYSISKVSLCVKVLLPLQQHWFPV